MQTRNRYIGDILGCCANYCGLVGCVHCDLLSAAEFQVITSKLCWHALLLNWWLQPKNHVTLNLWTLPSTSVVCQGTSCLIPSASVPHIPQVLFVPFVHFCPFCPSILSLSLCIFCIFCISPIGDSIGDAILTYELYYMYYAMYTVCVYVILLLDSLPHSPIGLI